MTTFAAVAVRRHSWQYRTLTWVRRENRLPKTRCGVWASIIGLPIVYAIGYLGIMVVGLLLIAGGAAVLELDELIRWHPGAISGAQLFFGSLLIGGGTAILGWITYRIAWRRWYVAAALGLLGCAMGIRAFSVGESLMDFFGGIWFTSYGTLLVVYAVAYASRQWWLPPLIQFYHWVCPPVEYID